MKTKKSAKALARLRKERTIKAEEKRIASNRAFENLSKEIENLELVIKQKDAEIKQLEKEKAELLKASTLSEEELKTLVKSANSYNRLSEVISAVSIGFGH